MPPIGTRSSTSKGNDVNSFRRHFGALAAISLFATAGVAIANAGAVRSSFARSSPDTTCHYSQHPCATFNNTGVSAGALGESTGGDGLQAIALSSGNGLTARSASGNGVDATSTSLNGVVGDAKGLGAGVLGITTNHGSSSSAGVEGQDSSSTLSSTNNGVLGITPNFGAAVLGNSQTTSPASTAAGVQGLSHVTNPPSGADSNAALSGISLGGVGLYAFSQSGGGAYFETAAPSIATLDIHADASNGFPLVSQNNVTHDHVDFDNQGDVLASGIFQGGGPYEVTQRTNGGNRVVTYGTQATEVTLEDVGTARLVGGSAVVSIEPRFASTIDGRKYHVFVTPDADSRGLYVGEKTPHGFTVRENQGGHSTLAFEYRIVAQPGDSHGLRLPAARNQLAGLTVRPSTARDALATLHRADRSDAAAPRTALKNAR